ncbi:hypothetical protein BST11_22515 [Mycobacterium alsense]|uniref:Pilin n=1 Tax=Mycobacterium alsense TaxID=324058 RepID=A0AA41XW83_9MYCO|nr:hypothetical protein [Mycobacterium alsense]MCV7381872.1 hypothetical protein [Mycobacterium alsense]OQZ88517.1 hypothetical protein BST11_22515 [Mycobacterium alsense]
MATVKRWVRWPTRALVSGGLIVSAFAPPVIPSAQAAHWCPGQQWDPAWGTNYSWDWNQCHDWQPSAAPGALAGWGPWGPPPPWAPPAPPPPSWAPQAHLMWNPTTGVWGFFNNGIWTPV